VPTAPGSVYAAIEAPTHSAAVTYLALTATRAKDEAVARAQVVRRQADGTWLRILDRPDFRGEPGLERR
jgi:hypothetical protein